MNLDMGICLKRYFVAIVMIVASVFCFSVPVFADGESENRCVQTSIIGDGESGNKQVCDDGSGSSIFRVLRIVLDILSGGVGIAGVIGVLVVGIQYLTAGDNQERTIAAKRRLYEIVIGLASYVVLFGLIAWLMPVSDVERSLDNFVSGGSADSQNSANKTNSFKIVNGKTYYLNKDGKRVTGQQKINSAEYYFNKKGVRQTGWVTIKNSKTGVKNKYFYKSDGRKAYGTIRQLSKYNEFGVKDKWYLNERTGALEGVDLAVPRIAQTDGRSCGPTAILMTRAYLYGKKDYMYNGSSYPWYAPDPWNRSCGVAEIWPDCLAKFGYGRYAGGKFDKEQALKQLFAGKPFIFRWYGSDAVDYGYAGDYGGHFMVISGYHDGVFTIKDPAGGSVPRKTSIDASLFERYWPTGYLTFYYLYRL